MIKQHLYLLSREDADYGYDENIGLVVRAASEAEARAFAAAQAVDEGPEVWKDPNSSSCTILRDAGAPGPVLISFNAG